MVTTTNLTDRLGIIMMIALYTNNLSSARKFVVDGGYSDSNFAVVVKQLCGFVLFRIFVNKAPRSNCKVYPRLSAAKCGCEAARS
ncbi:MAG: hypothetical protein Pg6C_04770 [Treponemataceae bacterium]|nr:MAG: hypothetical protein Pg6C_04770 [Treponemataceae bacterium]